MRTRSGSDYQTSDCQTGTPEENPTTPPEVNRSATPDVNRSAMAMDALDAAITSLDIDGPATNESLAQMLRGLAQMLTKSFGNIIAKKDAEIRELKVRVTALEEKTDDLEHYSRRNTVRIRGIPEALNEDTDGLVKDVATRKLDVQLTKHDFVRSHRVGRKSEEKDTPRDVIVRFTSHNTKVAVMRNARKLKGTHIFINEDLPGIQWNYPISIKHNPQYGMAVNEKMLEIEDFFGFTQIIKENTRGLNVLDICFAKTLDFYSNINIVPDISDHDAITVTVNQNRKPPRKVYQFKKADMTQVRDKCKRFCEYYTSQAQSHSASENWNTFKNGLRVGAGRQPNFQSHLSDIIFVYVHILCRHTPTFIVKQ